MTQLAAPTSTILDKYTPEGHLWPEAGTITAAADIQGVEPSSVIFHASILVPMLPSEFIVQAVVTSVGASAGVVVASPERSQWVVTTARAAQYPIPSQGLKATAVEFTRLVSGDPTAAARARIATFGDRAMAERAFGILGSLRKTLRGEDLTKLPPIRAFKPDDGSLLVEWMSDHWRIGFTIEPEPLAAEAGWYLVTDELLGNLRAYGDLNAVDIPWLVNWALHHLPE